MTQWNSAELEQIGAAEELDLESERGDGTLRAPVTMWVVRAGDHLYVRSVKGTTGPWYAARRPGTRAASRPAGYAGRWPSTKPAPASTPVWTPRTGRSTRTTRASSDTS